MADRTRRALLGAAALAALPGWARAQLGGRPAEEWIKVLENPQRLAGLRIPEVTAALNLRPGEVVADLGAGAGPFVPAFARAVGPTGKVYAVELETGFFPFIEQKAKAAGLANVRTVAGAPSDPRLPARDVDVAFMHDVLHHVAEREAYLKAVAGYLTRGGRVAIVDYVPAKGPHPADPSLQVSKAQAVAWMAAAGMKPVEDVAMFDDKWFVVFAR
jgi:ubiquinone/menaquinone biosynthesis C-methylase UbiE